MRRTRTLREFEDKDLTNRCREVVSSYSPRMLKRALSYLYTKETKSSFEIEHIEPSGTRLERFVALLQLAEREDFCEKSRLIELQNRTVDERFGNPITGRPRTTLARQSLGREKGCTTHAQNRRTYKGSCRA